MNKFKISILEKLKSLFLEVEEAKYLQINYSKDPELILFGLKYTFKWNIFWYIGNDLFYPLHNIVGDINDTYYNELNQWAIISIFLRKNPYIEKLYKEKYKRRAK